MAFCKVVNTDSRERHWSLYWVLTLECGREELRLRRRYNERHEHKAPTRVKCDCKSKPPAKE